MRTIRSIAWALAATACLTLAGRGAARADYDETEARLKAAGIDAPLRKQVHEAIERGVKYLLSRQESDGSWQDATAEYRWGKTALCALALRHAGSVEAKASVHRALEWLLPAEDGEKGDDLPGLRVGSSDGGLSQVYDAGLCLMLLAADGRPSSRARNIAKGLAGGIDPETGWWGYSCVLLKSPLERHVRGIINLSTTQFAALGLWAASRMAIAVDPGVWSKHADGLCRAQKPSGSWAYSPSMETSDGAPADMPGYPTGTFVGVANLALARKALEGVDAPDSDLRRRVDAAWTAARKALDRDARDFLDGCRDSSPQWVLSPTSGFSYYSLYALEKACIFASLEKVGGLLWYAEGARTLIRFQGREGSWSYKGGNDPLVSTSFALLFLLRSSQSYHPVTPRDPDSRPSAPPAPTTPGNEGGTPPGK